jgi:UDP-glucuronate 4-epimerase
MLGHLTILEACRALPNFKHMVYASSSSVYGANQKLPFSVEDSTDHPVSFYGATKKSCELASYSYSHLFRLPITGLRFFTVYGPWGRPDMSAFLFTKAILKGEEIAVFNRGDMRRSYTYIDDIVKGTISCLDKPPVITKDSVPHRVYNIGNDKSEPLLRFIEIIEKEVGKKAKVRLEPMQLGDVKESFADIKATTRDFGFVPETNIDQGLKHFVAWYKEYYNV